MTKHIVMWNFIETLSESEKIEAGEKIKTILEALPRHIDGLISAKVVINKLESSNRDITLFTELESVDALKKYQTHPKHVEAGQYVKSVTCDRACLDFEE